MTYTQKIAAFCHDVSVHGIPERVEEKAKACIADAFHALLLALPSETSILLSQYLSQSAGVGQSSMAGRGLADPESAALYNASLAAVHEIDDVHYDTSLHPGAVIVPAALSACESVNASPKRLMAAVAVGYEVAVRLSVAAGYRHYHFFHSATTCGTVGAAAAASVALNLPAHQIQNALGLAVTSASGLWEGITDQAVMVKHLHLGQAAERGIRSARLAALGWPAAPQALEGPRGFLAALDQPGEHAPGEAPSPAELERILTDGLGKTWAIERNIFKRVPFCLGVSEPLEGLRELLRQHPGRKQEIAEIIVESSHSVAWLVGNSHPQDECQARFSAPYALSLLLAGLNPETVPLPIQWLTHPDVEKWLPKIKMVGRSDIGSRKALVTVVFQNGERFTADQPLRNMTNQEAFARLGGVARDYMGATGERLAEIVSALDQQQNLLELGTILRSGA